MIIRIDNRQKAVRLDRARVRRHIRILLQALDLADRELSLVFTDDKGIQEINRDYLDRDRPTNVISFALGEGEFAGVNPEMLGDIVISVERATTDAAAAGIPFADELDFLVIHGLLHLIGYDHEGGDAVQATAMKRKEQDLFLRLTGYRLDGE